MQTLSPLRANVDTWEEQILRVLLDKHCLSILKHKPIANDYLIKIDQKYNRERLAYILRLTFQIF